MTAASRCSRTRFSRLRTASGTSLLRWRSGARRAGPRRSSTTVPSAIGFIAVFGVAMLNGIVLVSFLNDQRRHGLSVREAVRQGAALRLRPVLMTASVAALGFLPMALASGLEAAGELAQRLPGLWRLGRREGAAAAPEGASPISWRSRRAPTSTGWRGCKSLAWPTSRPYQATPALRPAL